MPLPTLERYLAREVRAAVAFVLSGFLALFAFFDLINELRDLGTGDYHLLQVFTVVLLWLPTRAYELLPVAVLIGTLYVLAHLSSNSEYTVMRASGLSPAGAARALGRAGLPFVLATFLLGEWIAPAAEEAAQKTRMAALAASIGQGLRSGLWFKDGRTFVNVREARDARALGGVYIYEFDDALRLRAATVAERAEHIAAGRWRLVGAAQTRFADGAVRTEHHPELEWRSALTPALVDVLIVAPERMSAWRLWLYTRHLEANRQKTGRYEIALWKKLFYPLAVFVMMALALPFAYLHARSGMVGVKVFLGILLGIFFHMLNSLAAHLGVLQHWPAPAAAAVPGLLFLCAAAAMMWSVERR